MNNIVDVYEHQWEKIKTIKYGLAGLYKLAICMNVSYMIVNKKNSKLL